MSDRAKDARIEDLGGHRIAPVASSQTTRQIDNGDAGTRPLPVIDVAGGYIVAFVPPRKALRAMLRTPHVLQLMIADDGSLSLTAMPVAIVKDN